MKKCMLILLVCLAVVAPLAAAGNEGDISVGVLLGQPLGLTGKYVINDDLSVAALVGVAGGAWRSTLMVTMVLMRLRSKISICIPMSVQVCSWDLRLETSPWG